MPLLVLVAASVLQVALAVHVRATLTAAAAEGARAAALAGADGDAGRRRVAAVTAGTVAGSAIRDIAVGRGTERGIPVVEVRISAVLPLLGLLGPTSLEVAGHALREDAT